MENVLVYDCALQKKRTFVLIFKQHLIYAFFSTFTHISEIRVIIVKLKNTCRIFSTKEQERKYFLQKLILNVNFIWNDPYTNFLRLATKNSNNFLKYLLQKTYCGILLEGNKFAGFFVQQAAYCGSTFYYVRPASESASSN